MPTLNKHQIKLIRSLHQKKYRQKHQLFLLEGEKLVNEVLRDKPEIVQGIIIQKNYAFPKNINADIYEADEKIYNSLSQLVSPPPVMAICKYLNNDKEIIIDLKNSFSFYLDGINDPGNFGTIIRMCDWFGIQQIFCSSDTVEIYNPKVIQASKGSFLRVNVMYIEIDKLLSKINREINIYGADMNGKSIYEIKEKKGIIILGNEANGISDKMRSIIHQYISIPKSKNSKAESLNVAMSAGIIASEFLNLQNVY